MPPPKIKFKNKQPTTLVLLRQLNKSVTVALIILVILYFYSRYKVKELPDARQIASELRVDPKQTAINPYKFKFDYRGETYLVDAIADYEIAGLIVSHNDITAWYDIYHTKDSVDTKDLCLIWGNNVDGNHYHNVKFYNESVSCHFHINDQDTYVKFNPGQLSNNHLISDSEAIRKSIASARVGDQILMKGYLVNYSSNTNPEFVRRTSTTRKDTAGGACEVVFVNEFEILKKYPRRWHNISDFVANALPLTLLLKILLFLFLPAIEFRLE